MKKRFFVFAGCAIILASCGSKGDNQGQTKEQMDSSVNAQVAAKEAAIKAQSDSTINAEAAKKASEHREHENEGKKHEGNGNAANTPAPAPAPPPPAPVNVRPGAGNSGAKSVNDRSGAH